MTTYATAQSWGASFGEERKRKGYTQSKPRASPASESISCRTWKMARTSELGKTLRVLQTLGMDLSADSRDA